MRIRMIALTSSAVAAALILAGCSNTGGMSGMDHSTDPMPSSSSDSTAFNDADVAFTMNMIAHHQQAIEMADTVLAKDGVDEQVLTLAGSIKEAQGPEIETMASWLEAWDQSANMGGMSEDGMMTAGDMAALEAASGPEASRLFLEQMIVHHQGAIDMANDEVADGQNSDAIALAEKIITDQAAEILTMQQLLNSL